MVHGLQVIFVILENDCKDNIDVHNGIFIVVCRRALLRVYAWN